MTSSARSGLFFIPLIIILPQMLGITGVIITQAIADILTFILCLPIVLNELKKMDEQEAGNIV